MIVGGGLIVTMDPGLRLLDPGWLRIDGPHIREVSNEPLVPSPDEEVLETGGMVVLPGFVNTHTHLFQTLLRAVYDQRPLSTYLSKIYGCGLELTYEDCRIAALAGSAEAICSGVTTLVDHHFLNRRNELVTGTIDGLLASGVRAVVARTVMDIGDGLPDAIKEPPDRAMADVDELITAYRDEEAEGRLLVMTGPNTPGINASDQACRVTMEYGRDRGRRLSAHVAEYYGVRETVARDHGVDGVVRWLHKLGVLSEFLLSVHTVQVDDDEVRLLADHGVAVSHNPVSNLLCGDRNAPIDVMRGTGVPVGVGTDGAANNHGQGVLDAVRITRLLQRSRPEPFAITAEDGLRMATIEGARALGLDHLIGSIEVGKRADLAILSLREPHLVPFQHPVAHLANFAKGSDVRNVLVDGRIVLRDQQLQTVDIAELLARTDEAGRSLVGRLG